jgi:hypothetical protein
MSPARLTRRHCEPRRDATRRALVATLTQIRDILPSDKASWDAEPLRRLAVERLWITAGNLAEIARSTRGADPGVEPWSELAGYRNLLAHALPGDISSDRVYADSTSDVTRLIDQVRAHQG